MMLEGTAVALVTPFTEKLEVDYPKLEELIEWQIEEGVEGIVLYGTTGEAPTVSFEEKIQILKKGVEVARKRVPIIAGTGGNDTRKSVLETEKAKEEGADAALVVVPYYNRPSFAGCFAHYQKIAEVGLPFFVYHHPGRTGVTLTPQMLGEISLLSSVVGIKEASGEEKNIAETIRCSLKPVFSGDDMLLYSTIRAGGKGVFSVLANLVPREWKRCVDHLMKKEEKEARLLFEKYIPLCQALFLETNPQGIKYALSLVGKSTPHLRLPLVELSEPTKQKIYTEMKKLKLIRDSL